MTDRGRRRGSSQRNFSGVSQGTIRRRGSSRGLRDPLTSLRRSARLSELLAARDSDSQDEAVHRSDTTENDSQLWSTNSVTGSEPSSLINRAQAPQDTSPNHRRGFSRLRGEADSEPGTAESCMNDVIDGSNTGQYIMNILIDPPNQIRPGHLLNPPLILRLDQPPSEDPHSVSTDDPTLLWAVVSLFPADSDTPIVPPQNDLLLGTHVDSVHPLTLQVPGREVGFVSFPDLAIREPGQYRLQISLIRMNSAGPSSNVPPFEGGTNIQHTFTRVITVVPDANPLPLGQSSRTLLLLGS